MTTASTVPGRLWRSPRGIVTAWELAKDYPGTWEAMEALVLDPLGVLHSEPRRLLLDDLRDPVQSASILSLAGQGCARSSEIAGRLGKPATSLSRPLARLLNLEFLDREVPFGDPVRSSKRSLYRVSDPFLSFWFRYVDPNRSRLQAGAVRQVLEEIRTAVSGHISIVWEALVRSSLPRLPIRGSDWFPGQRWWGPGLDKRPIEVDVVAESADGRSALIGEAKLTLATGDLQAAAAELAGKIARLPFIGRYDRAVPVLFVAQPPGRKAKGVDIITSEDIFSLSEE